MRLPIEINVGRSCHFSLSLGNASKILLMMFFIQPHLCVSVSQLGGKNKILSPAQEAVILAYSRS